MIDLRKPQIVAPTPSGQIQEIKSYLFRLVDDLQYQINQYEVEISKLKAEIETLKEKSK